MADTEKKGKRKHRRSLILNAIDRLAAMIYSFFTNGRIGDMLSSNDTLCKRSYLAGRLSNEKGGSNSRRRRSEIIMEESSASRIMVFLRSFLASLKLNVYGVFFTFFGLSAAVITMIPALSGGMNAVDQSALIICATITLCAIPPMFASQSAAEAIFKSKFLSKIMLNVLCIPEEKFKTKKQYGGTVYVFLSAIAAMLLGALSYYTHVLFVPLALLCVFVLFLIFSSPESGVIITLALVPFMQYIQRPKVMIMVLVVATAASYFTKVVQRRRRLMLSPEICMVLLFCGFVFMGAFFSHGCTETLFDTINTIVIILGGFLLTYNLVNSEKLLSAAFKTMRVSFILLCAMGVWEGVVYGISNRIIDKSTLDIARLAGDKIIYIADNGVVFGLFAILMFPMLFAYAARKKSVKSAASVAIICVLAICAAWMCSHYEIIVALVIEIIIYWFVYSHKTLTTVLIALIPIGILMLLYPFAIIYLKFPDISGMLAEYMPAQIPDAEMHPSVVRDVVVMIRDGHWAGIGAGEHAFVSEFSQYAGASSVGATNPMSLWLEILCWSGIFGFISFAMFVIFLMKRSLGSLIDQRSNELRARTLSVFTGLVVAMLFGCVYGIWTDVRILYLFWACTGLLVGYIRLGREHNEIRDAQFDNLEDSKDVEVIFYE